MCERNCMNVCVCARVIENVCYLSNKKCEHARMKKCESVCKRETLCVKKSVKYVCICVHKRERKCVHVCLREKQFVCEEERV